jgi:hypothetical protein
MSVKLNKSPSTFDGKDNCGGVCYLLDYFLNKHGYENTLTTTDRGCFTTRETHTYLVNGHFIIDPTYRQMFLPDYSNILNINGNDAYHTFLFQHLPMTYIGTYQELTSLHNKLSKLHENVYDKELESKIDMWQDGRDDSLKSDLTKVVDSLQYASSKGAPYIKLHCMLHHSKDIFH